MLNALRTYQWPVLCAVCLVFGIIIGDLYASYNQPPLGNFSADLPSK